MARLWSSGGELNSITNDVEFAFNNNSTLSSDVKKSGSYSMFPTPLNSGNLDRFQIKFSTSDANGPFFFRNYFMYTALPTADNRIISIRDSSGTNRIWIDLSSTGTLELNDEDGIIGDVSSVLLSGVWYYIEIKCDLSGAGATDIVEAKLNGLTFSSSNVRNLSTGVANYSWGGNLILEAQTTGTWYHEDVAINDTSGSYENSWCGKGSIRHLNPVSAGDSTSWTPSAGSNFENVDEVTPDDATTYNSSSTLDQEDLFNVTDSDIQVGEYIKLVQIGVRFTNLVGADATAAFKVEAIKISGGTKSQSSAIIPNSTTWKTNGTSLMNYPLTLYTDPDGNPWTKETLNSMQIGYIITATNTRAIAVTKIWALVEYAPIVDKPHNYGRYIKVGGGTSRSESAT